MKLRYLGTSAAEAFPAPFCECAVCREALRRGGKNWRTRSQALLNDDLLFDFPPDAYTHIRDYGIDMRKISHILVTHCHEDHLYLHDLLLRRPDWLHFDQSRSLFVWGNDRLMAMMEQWRTQPFVQEVERSTHFMRARPGVSMQCGEYTVTPLKADHSPQEECMIYLVGQQGKYLLYAHDTGWFPEETWQALQGTRLALVSLDCNNMIQEGEHNHMGLKTCVAVRNKLRQMGCCDESTVFVLNHFSHNGGICHEEFSELAGREGFLVSWDGMEIRI